MNFTIKTFIPNDQCSYVFNALVLFKVSKNISFDYFTASGLNERVQLLSCGSRLDVQQQQIRGKHFKTQWSRERMETTSQTTVV